ncbi:hypothetical protein V8E52_011407 [Russula decolorans]|jgi:hypothetical protein
MSNDTGTPSIIMTPLTANNSGNQIDLPTSPTEARRSRRLGKRTQKDANIGDILPENSLSSTTTEREKKRKTGTAPVTACDTPEQPQTPFDFTFPSQLTMNSPLIEESFHPQMMSPYRESVTAPLLNNETPMDITTSEANTSLSLDTSLTRTASSLKDRMIAAKEHGTKINTNSAVSNDPIDKYTKGSMPNVYYSHPTAALDFIDIDQVGDWENLPDGKLLAHPFGHEVRSMVAHQEIKTNLFAAVLEITQSDSVAICAPRPPTSPPGTPSVFLIYNISELHRQMLLKCEVWSSTVFTFRTTTLDPVSPSVAAAMAPFRL